MKTATGISLLLAALLLANAPNRGAAQDDAPVYDKDINVVHFEELNYVPVAHAANIQGVVVVRVILDDKGDVVKAIAISGNHLLIPACVANAKKWKFQPNPHKLAVIVYHFIVLPLAVCEPNAGLFTLQGANLATITACPFLATD